MHHRNVNDRKEAIKNIKRLIRRKEKENQQLDADLEELALSVAERRNVNEANGTWNALCCSQLIGFLRCFAVSCLQGSFIEQARDLHSSLSAL